MSLAREQYESNLLAEVFKQEEKPNKATLLAIANAFKVEGLYDASDFIHTILFNL